MSRHTDTPIAVDRLGAGRDVATVDMPSGVTVGIHQLSTFDGAKVEGVLHALDGATTVVTIMHPRQSVAHHPIIPLLLRSGVSVWTQTSRSVNNDLALVHEQAVLDVAAGMNFLRDDGFESILTFGHSGGGTLYAYYVEQAAIEPEHRVDVTPAGRPIALAGARMPVPDGAIFLAPHPGQGQVLLSCIDPSVSDENDPLSVDPSLDMYDPANGFTPAPEPSHYSAEFLARYRKAQHDRVTRIDAVARERAAEASQARARFARTGAAADRRASLAPRLITTYRTDADPRYVDLTIDRNDRHYGSLFGRRPDLINYGLVGFGRLTTPDAWLSTWSALSTNADFVRCAAGVHVPTLFLELSGDQVAVPAVGERMYAAVAATDKTHGVVRGQHFGQPIAEGEPTGYEAAATLIDAWVSQRYATARS
ncbi:MAG: alpha/beta hydrolase [Pseudonocardia sp.]|uniref:alpha/beta hydrolase n=1 Tax=unclassified Pseudonocardia TaxID=2619320 RepID=UPI0008689F9B|nr:MULTISPECIES: alpha/beta hydrolase [unclassified Pseudonocardia]MBN9107294.1 alpha/beta hydrolase [Pseudonocardia sp.]ODU29117.1 MAG: alpha/beta hydrolase [Pseudonocardia sp. SCN 72-51]ODV06548.1 MAG: alpha/beta hydrolase [Pseudonocardia sp. SCN 73-27]